MPVWFNATIASMNTVIASMDARIAIMTVIFSMRTCIIQEYTYIDVLSWNLYKCCCIHLILDRWALSIANFFLRPPRILLGLWSELTAVVSRDVRGCSNSKSSREGMWWYFTDFTYLAGRVSGCTYLGSVLADSSFITHNDAIYRYIYSAIVANPKDIDVRDV